MKTLQLNLKTETFNVMVTGEKNVEYRDIKPWSNSRPLNKDGSTRHYDLVRFTLGYGATKLYFICKYKGLSKASNVSKVYSNGFKINFEDERWCLMLGEIIEDGNMESISSI